MSTAKAAGRWFLKRFVVALVNLLAPPRHFRPLDVVRRAMLALVGMRVGSNTFVSGGFFVFDGHHLCIGTNGNLGAFARIWDFAPVRIGDRLLCSHNLTIVAGTHEKEPPYLAVPGPVTIGDDVWIGVNVTIVGPCTIGDGVILGANSFATGDLSGPGVYVGSPARLKGTPTEALDSLRR